MEEEVEIVKNLINGNIYKVIYNRIIYIFKYAETGGVPFITSKKYSPMSSWRFFENLNIMKALDLEKSWLETCIYHNKFISKEEMIREYDIFGKSINIIPKRISFYVKYTKDFTAELLDALEIWSKNNSKGKHSNYKYGYDALRDSEFYVFDNWGLNCRNYESNWPSYGIDNNSQGCHHELSIDQIKKLIGYQEKEKSKVAVDWFDLETNCYSGLHVGNASGFPDGIANLLSCSGTVFFNNVEKPIVTKVYITPFIRPIKFKSSIKKPISLQIRTINKF